MKKVANSVDWPNFLIKTHNNSQVDFSLFLGRMGLLPEQQEQKTRNHAGMNNDKLPYKISTAENLIKVNNAPVSKNWAA